MTRPLALLRPEPGWSTSAVKAREMGLEVVGHPLFDPAAVAWRVPEGEFDALLIGSATVFALGGPQLAELRGLPVYAVGASTAESAQSAGFAVAQTGQGGLQAMLDAKTGETVRFLRVGGEERVTLTPHHGQSITEAAIYRMMPRALASDFAGALVERAPLVALHSAAAARQFAAEVDRLAIARGTLFLIALGPRIAKAAGTGWAAVHLADTPSDAALLAKAAALCK